MGALAAAPLLLRTALLELLQQFPWDLSLWGRFTSLTASGIYISVWLLLSLWLLRTVTRKWKIKLNSGKPLSLFKNKKTKKLKKEEKQDLKQTSSAVGKGGNFIPAPQQCLLKIQSQMKSQNPNPCSGPDLCWWLKGVVQGGNALDFPGLSVPSKVRGQKAKLVLPMSARIRAIQWNWRRFWKNPEK